MKKYGYNETIEPIKMLEIDQNIELLTTFNLTNIEMEYLEFAIKMPTSEIKTFIEFYDNSDSRYDELKFISMLMTRYSETSDNIIKRIGQVRRLIKYEKQLEESKNFSKILKK